MRQAATIDGAADLRGLGDADGDLDNARRPQEHSRSTSTSSSPAPPDNEESDFFFGANDSQSSLGVPNLQDMLVVDDACMPPVHRLPNEILIAIFAKLSSSSDILHVMLTCKRWARNAVDILWHRPSCSNWSKHESICQTLSLENPYFSYRDFVRRLNLSALADKVNDGSVMPLAECTRVERMTLTGCAKLSDSGLIALVSGNSHLYSLDVSLPPQTSIDATRDHITEASIDAIAEHCPRLQGLNISNCQRISNESLVRLAQACRYLKRLKLNECGQIKDEAILAFAEYCPNILEIDLQQCRLIGNEPVTALFAKGQALRELRLANCDRVDDFAFLSLPPYRSYDHLRILDLTSCIGITDRAVEKIIEVAPRLRNLVLQKCRNLTDAAVYAISRLARNLHFLHLGHCSNITDDGVKRLISLCNRIRYIDLGCCTNLTDDSVTKLASLPKLKRIGLVKCANITDASVIALANANRRPRMRRDPHGNLIPVEYSTSQSCLERVHLSYCTNLTQTSIIRLLNSCPRLTHLSLTGVQAFLRDDLDAYSRAAPPEFTEHQRSVFCVFSGQGVANLRRHFNSMTASDEPRRNLRTAPGGGPAGAIFPNGGLPVAVPHLQNLDTGFDDGDPDTVDDDDDVPENGSEMVIDTQPLLGTHVPPPPAHHVDGTVNPTNPFSYVAGHPPYIPQSIPFHGVPVSFTAIAPLHYAQHVSYPVVSTAAAAQENVAATNANADLPVTAQAAATNGTAATTDNLSELTAIEALIDISSQLDVNAQYGAAQASVGPQSQPPPPGGAGGA
ncbi:SCF E3 ubiquitin ligase complex F-box protein grrA [Staphylotrichum tortipilum]|uniref:SCF E3 ubiquitin ligase complex F-box protein grrA n=1 Tax=Staphylotrichum tortipilum TaxID=2831512 RepID=A0AAN6MPT3_9PEZI|nr:SCF E3 ubiquitin ligase complex F-box protein grrA [Staphylotrichum longicolle]